jgi:YbbR domain-containing protein
VRSSIDISGETETLQKTIPVEVVDENGETIHDVTVTPNEISVTQPINLLGGFKNVVVKVTTTGQVANGYRLTNVSVSPPTVTVFSEDPRKIDGIPGFVDTLPVDLTDLSDDIEINVGLSLPPGIELVRVPDVLVQVSLAAIESSRTYSVPVEVVGLAQELEAAISPIEVDVIAAGPINILDILTPADFRIILDLEGLPAGIYQRSPEVERVPDQVRVQTTLPETVEVDISVAPTPTPTATVLATPSVTPTP